MRQAPQPKRAAPSPQETTSSFRSSRSASPVPALLTLLFVLTVLAHAVVGLRSILIDYVHARAWMVAAELAVRSAAVLLAGASGFAVLKIFLGR
jgi:succinate dehydrogenase / fumarate reductase, membrane anchor subunit